MYLFEKGEFVIYKGDMSTMQEERRKPSLAIVDRIDEDKFPHVGLKLVPKESFIGVEARLIRNILTERTHLLKLGFQEFEENNVKYYALGSVIIAEMVIYPKPRSVYFAGFRILPYKPFQFTAKPFIENNEVDENKLQETYPNMNNLNELISHLKALNLTSMDIPDIVDVNHFSFH